jgi:hypothetical protein
MARRARGRRRSCARHRLCRQDPGLMRSVHARRIIAATRLPSALSPHDAEPSPHIVTDEESSPCGEPLKKS